MTNTNDKKMKKLSKICFNYYTVPVLIYSVIIIYVNVHSYNKAKENNEIKLEQHTETIVNTSKTIN